MPCSCGTGTKHLFPWNVVCVCVCVCHVWQVCSLAIQGWVSVFITLLIGWVGLVCKSRMLSACHLVICEGGLVVDVASIAMVIMAMRRFSWVPGWAGQAWRHWTYSKTRYSTNKYRPLRSAWSKMESWKIKQKVYFKNDNLTSSS